MITVQISTASGVKQIFTTETAFKIHELRDRLNELSENFYFVHNGKLADENVICYDGYVSLIPRLFGGKGGFGSMLRAIGAQIEKTTNREACRDLSGRRLRDINEEKRLKAWIEKQGNREKEAEERKKKKLERLCAEPKHEFKDQTYERERSVLTERVGDAVEEGFKAATTGVKRKLNEDFKPSKKKILLDPDIDSDELNSSNDSEEDENKSEEDENKSEEDENKSEEDENKSEEDENKSEEDENKSDEIIKETEPASNDSGHSSDESGKTVKNNEHTRANS